MPRVKIYTQVSSRIRADLLQRAGEFNIKLEDVSITHLTFGKVRVPYASQKRNTELTLIFRNLLKPLKPSKLHSKVTDSSIPLVSLNLT